MKKSPLNQSITLPLERPSTPELPPPPSASTDAGAKDDEEVVQNVPDKAEAEVVQEKARGVKSDSNTLVEEEIVQDVEMEDVSKPPAPEAETAPLSPASHIAERVTVESPGLGLETGRVPAGNTPPILANRLPPVTTGPTPPDSTSAMAPRLPERRSTPRMRFADLPSDNKQDTVEQKNEAQSTSTPKEESPDVFGNESAQTVVNETVEINSNRTPNAVTIAERRAVTLPPNVVPPPRTHAGSRMRKSFPAESIISGQPSPRTEASSAAPSELSEEERALKIAAAIKSAQRDHLTFGPLLERQIDIINAENSKVAPRSESLPPERTDVNLVKKISAEMQARYSAKRLIQARLRREAEERAKRHARLRRTYESLQQRWEENHQVLDDQMAARPPMPSKIYEMILSRKETEELAIIDESSRNRNRQATQAQLEAVMEASRLDDELHPNRLADINGVETIPDMLPLEERRWVYDDDNDLVDDPLEFYDFAGNSEPIWTDAEKAIFAKIFPNCQKQFGKIADKLPGKSVGDCVLYYYRTKKDLEWKREPAKGTIAAKKVAKPAKRGPKPSLPERSPSPPAGMPTPIVRGGAIGGRGRGRGRVSGISTPGDKPGRRKVSAIDTLVEGQSSETTSRAASETPAAGKGKARVPKAKRPRESSVLDPSGLSAQANETETPAAEDPDADSLPTAKRGGKRRKVGPDGQPIEGEEKGDKRRRAGQNSYWNNDEKAAFARLSALYPGDFARIAHELGNTKTVKQVENWNTKNAAEETKQPVPVCSTIQLKITLMCSTPLELWTFIHRMKEKHNNLDLALSHLLSLVHQIHLGLAVWVSLPCSIQRRSRIKRMLLPTGL
jgi:serine/arginine repetitive matrix protein 2